MRYYCKLLDTRDNTEHVIESLRDLEGYDYIGDMDHTFIGYWTEGNFECDCNRSIALYGWDNQLECNSGENIIKLLEIKREDDIIWDGE